jgi:hypothetical protein
MENVQDTIKEIECWLKKPGSYTIHKLTLASAFKNMVLLTVQESLKDSNSRVPKDFKVAEFKRKVLNLEIKKDFERIAEWVEKQKEPKIRADHFSRFLTNYVNSLANKFYMQKDASKAKLVHLSSIPLSKISQVSNDNFKEVFKDDMESEDSQGINTRELDNITLSSWEERYQENGTNLTKIWEILPSLEEAFEGIKDHLPYEIDIEEVELFTDYLENMNESLQDWTESFRDDLSNLKVAQLTNTDNSKTSQISKLSELSKESQDSNDIILNFWKSLHSIVTNIELNLKDAQSVNPKPKRLKIYTCRLEMVVKNLLSPTNIYFELKSNFREIDKRSKKSQVGVI